MGLGMAAMTMRPKGTYMTSTAMSWPSRSPPTGCSWLKIRSTSVSSLHPVHPRPIFYSYMKLKKKLDINSGSDPPPLFLYIHIMSPLFIYLMGVYLHEYHEINPQELAIIFLSFMNIKSTKKFVLALNEPSPIWIAFVRWTPN